jgi:hypothetical protein
MVERGATARMLAKIADTNFAARLGMCTSGNATQHCTPQISEKTWVAMSRNSGQHGAYFGPASALAEPEFSLKKMSGWGCEKRHRSVGVSRSPARR